MSKEEFKVSNMFIDSLKTQQELYYKAKIEKIYQQKLKDLQQKVEQLENIRKEAIEYIKNNKETRKHYEPYGTPMRNSNYTTTHIFGYYELLDILNKGGASND